MQHEDGGNTSEEDERDLFLPAPNLEATMNGAVSTKEADEFFDAETNAN